ncbi:MAG: hypothetical protein JWN25_743 [Verrucomicrobiales bacterium]|nr:hypothetical protein [Verrucomicrobiales bacterium]
MWGRSKNLRECNSCGYYIQKHLTRCPKCGNNQHSLVIHYLARWGKEIRKPRFLATILLFVMAILSVYLFLTH